MAVPSSLMMLVASEDADLLARARAVAAAIGVVEPEFVVQRFALQIVAAPLDESGSTIARVYDYGETLRLQALAEVPEPTGMNPAAVTDEHLEAALRYLIGQGLVQATSDGEVSA